MKNLNILEVKTLLEEGKLLKRSCWDKDIFIFKQNTNDVLSEIVPKMNSLSNYVKEEFKRRFDSNSKYQVDRITYHNQLVIVNNSNLITTYQFSNDDFFAEDWVEYKN